jgi:biotin synthase
VPINALVPVKGTPLEGQPPVDPLEMVRMIAVARLMLPASMVRLSAGRAQMTEEAQLLCLLAGANSVFFGDRLLTTGNPGYEQDMQLFARAGIEPLAPNVDKPVAE